MIYPAIDSEMMEIVRQEALSAGFSRAAPLDVSSINVYPELRAFCTPDTCPSYGTNWTCPPGCGSIAQKEEQLRRYEKGILVQSFFPLETGGKDEIQAVHQQHQQRLLAFRPQLAARWPWLLMMGSGGCFLCDVCTYPDAPCRRPDDAFHSISAFGIKVSELCETCGLPLESDYGKTSGKQSITFTGCFLLTPSGQPQNSKG